MAKAINAERADNYALENPDDIEARLWFAMKKSGVGTVLVHRLINTDTAKCDRKTPLQWVYGESKASTKYHKRIEEVIKVLNVVVDSGHLEVKFNRSGNIKWLSSTLGLETLNAACRAMMSEKSGQPNEPRPKKTVAQQLAENPNRAVENTGLQQTGSSQQNPGDSSEHSDRSQQRTSVADTADAQAAGKRPPITDPSDLI